MAKRRSGVNESLQTGFLGIIAFAVLLFMLVQAKFLLITLAIAIIIFSLTSDVIAAFARLKVPTWFATTLALVAISIGLLWAATTLIAQMSEIVTVSITYSERAQAQLPELLEWLGPNAREAVLTFVRNIDVAGWIRSAASQASNLLSAVFMILIYVGFMFGERLWYPIKIANLTRDDADALKVRAIISTIMSRVNRYLFLKAMVSGVTAVLVWLIFRIAGLELAGPIAMLTFILNFIPTIGSIVATMIAILSAMVQTGSIPETVTIGIVCSIVQFSIGNVFEPMLLGQTLRMSSFGIVLSLAFWGAVWGIPGMFLSVPIMAAIMVICAQIPWLRSVAVLLSRDGYVDDCLGEGQLAVANQEQSTLN